jgi:hypothetical protein
MDLITHIKTSAVTFNCFKDIFDGLIINEIPEVFPMLPVLIANAPYISPTKDPGMVSNSR